MANWMAMEPQPPGPDGNQKPFKISPARSQPQILKPPPYHPSEPPRTATAISFQRQLPTGITPHQLAQNGLYHQVRAGVGDTACCFTCEAEIPLKAIQEKPTGDLSKFTKKTAYGKLFATTLNRSYRLHILNPMRPLSQTHLLRSLLLNLIRDPNLPWHQQLLHSPRPAPNITLTIEDLDRRIHNKPSPFQLENTTRQRTIKRTRKKTAFVTQSLTIFLASALLAFSRFLTEMQPSDTCYPSRPQFHYSRAMKAA
ncbi:hypothetical protein N7488_007943 [Penicillium malachiteum]|nr:hypothetical protein N7488_007943 [Penicillium malachiteum]